LERQVAGDQSEEEEEEDVEEDCDGGDVDTIERVVGRRLNKRRRRKGSKDK
jgi:hypothetical protein